MLNKKFFKILLISFFYFVPFFGLGTSEEIEINSSELNILEGGKVLLTAIMFGSVENLDCISFLINIKLFTVSCIITFLIFIILLIN